MKTCRICGEQQKYVVCPDCKTLEKKGMTTYNLYCRVACRFGIKDQNDYKLIVEKRNDIYTITIAIKNNVLIKYTGVKYDSEHITLWRTYLALCIMYEKPIHKKKHVQTKR